MANKKITELPSISAPLKGSDLWEVSIDDGGSFSSHQTTGDELKALLGLNGTYYSFVKADGSDVDNAAQFIDAYNDAASKVQQFDQLTSVPTTPGGLYVMGGTLFISPASEFILTTGNTYTYILDGIEYTGDVTYTDPFFTQITTTAPDSTYNIFEIYLPSYKSATLLVAPGYYNFESDFIASVDYVNIVSLDKNRSVIFNGYGTFVLTASYVRIIGIDVLDKQFVIDSAISNNIYIENCAGTGKDSFQCKSAGDVNKFVNCKGGNDSFNGEKSSGYLSGTYIDCIGGNNSFGKDYINVFGTFINCKASNNSFGGDYSYTYGTFKNCSALQNSFGGAFSSSYGSFKDCTGVFNSFGGFASLGLFENCKSYGNSFGFDAGTTAGGVCINCESGSNSYGTNGYLTGQLYNCRISNGSGVFPIVSGSGRTYYCVDGYGNPNNQ